MTAPTVLVRFECHLCGGTADARRELRVMARDLEPLCLVDGDLPDDWGRTSRDREPMCPECVEKRADRERL